MIRKKTIILGLGALTAFGVLLAAGLGAWHLFGPRRTPEGQAPLVSLTRDTLHEFRDAFNGASDRTRVLAMLSPT